MVIVNPYRSGALVVVTSFGVKTFQVWLSSSKHLCVCGIITIKAVVVTVYSVVSPKELCPIANINTF